MNTSICCLLLLLVKTLAMTSLTPSEDDFTAFRQELHQLRNDMRQLQAVVEQQNRVIDEQKNEINRQRDEFNQQRETNEAKFDKQNYEIIQLQASLELAQDCSSPASANTSQDSAYACVGESLTMQCDAECTIIVLSAEYGRYDNCSSGCCEPTDADCTEIMAETNAAEWQSIKDSCDGQTTCDYLYTGQLMENCTLNYTADYVKFLYHCTDFVGFSAYSTEDQYPNDGDIILFDGVETNAGGGYNSSTSVFTCPRSGFYYIFFNLDMDVDGGDSSCVVGIRKDGTLQASGEELNYNPNDHLGMSGQSVLLQCDVDSEIWIEADFSDNCQLKGSSSYKLSTFGGFILRQL